MMDTPAASLARSVFSLGCSLDPSRAGKGDDNCKRRGEQDPDSSHGKETFTDKSPLSMAVLLKAVL